MIYLFPPAWQDHTVTDAVDWAAQHNGRLKAVPGKGCFELVQTDLRPRQTCSTNVNGWSDLAMLRMLRDLRSPST